MFIEIPIFVADDDNGIDYEALGIERPDDDVITIKALVNLDHVERINSVENESYKTVLWIDNQIGYKTTISYKEVTDLINDTKNLS